MGTVKKWRKRKIAKHKHRKRLKDTRFQRRKNK
ncbi:MAG: 30S ribosomal protein bS22 [Chloroflexota bacterium]